MVMYDPLVCMYMYVCFFVCVLCVYVFCVCVLACMCSSMISHTTFMRVPHAKYKRKLRRQ